MTSPGEELAIALKVSDWRQRAITEVPRHLFAPRRASAMRGAEPAILVDAAADRAGWMRHVYDPRTAIIVQRDDGHVPADDTSGAPTSSMSAPDAVARFMELLDVQDGNRVLEIGTGSGWTAALLCHRLGDDQVITIEVDDALADRARKNLAAAGFKPVVITGDGVDGYLAGAPYDRIHVTCGISDIPGSWISQCHPGAIMVLPWMPTGYPGHQLRLHVERDGCATGRFHGTCGYMMLRSQRTRWHADDPADARTSFGRTNPRQIAQAGPGLHLMIAGRMPGISLIAVPDASGEFSLLLTDDGQKPSWAAADYYPDSDQTHVIQHGTRSLWDEAEAAHAAWLDSGSPVQYRYGLTITPAGQHLWLDQPEHVIPENAIASIT